ncbi:streptomycin biosynthesis enzyme StrG [Xanthovirga aplysinae]|uniref:streptomycin biosynthesis enzyme StrG n=1 Tax=Xanthovirga aplysinae TaxID=2529853 RepID=UPI0012BBA307|nr:streptomycin biosynthesis enzyme StrG [Xanthovirga aplysinae]MTI29736.1 streptomycin biosynthesis enzyme StrG [Xanthovirga aplysinae]
MQENFIIITYDIKKYPFQEILAKQIFKVTKLHELHIVLKKQTERNELNYNDNLVLRKLMQQISNKSLFYKIYHYWVLNILGPHYGYKISYSAHPKMRVHLAGTGSVSKFHRDVDITHRLDQINCYLPFTNVFESSTIWCETDYGSEIYEPINLEYGQAFLWDGGCLKHGSYANTTENTRVSCDFRFSYKGVTKEPWNKILSARKKQ